MGIFHFNVITSLFGEWSVLTRIFYILVGLSGLWQIIRYRSVCACYWAPAPESESHRSVTAH